MLPVLTEAVKGQEICEMQDDCVSTEHLLQIVALDKPATFKQFLKTLSCLQKN